MNSVENILERTCGELPKPLLMRWGAILFTVFVLTLQISLAVSQAALAGATVLYLLYLLQARPVIHFLPVKFPLALFCLFSIVPIYWSENPAIGWVAAKKLVLFLIWLLAINLVASAKHLLRLLQGMFLVSFFASLVGIAQFIIQYRDVRAHHPGQLYLYLTTRRIHGFMGHWMHFGGQQMLIFAMLLGYLLLSKASEGKSKIEDRKSKVENRNPEFENRNSKLEIGNAEYGIRNSELESRASEREPLTPKSNSRISTFDFPFSIFWWAILALVVVSIVLNFTRGVWLGCFVAGIYLLACWRPRWLWALPVLMLLAYVAAPSLVRERVRMVLHPSQELALSNRLEMWGVGLRMIRAHPWVGVGPNNIEEDYALYLPPGKTPELGYHNHLHNNFLQIGAERGLPCLAAWVWLMATLGWHTWKLRRRLSAQRWIADAALAALLAFLVEGCFEYNFGSSPVLMAFLFVTSTPFIAGSIAVSSQESENVGGTMAP